MRDWKIADFRIGQVWEYIGAEVRPNSVKEVEITRLFPQRDEIECTFISKEGHKFIRTYPVYGFRDHHPKSSILTKDSLGRILVRELCLKRS